MVSGRWPTVYWINLERSVARRAQMERNLAAHGFAGVRVVAVDGADTAATQAVLHSRADNPRVAACLASHLCAIRRAFEAGEELAIFMEDDASFELLPRWPGDFGDALASLPSDWSALWLAYGDTPQRLDRLFQMPGLVVEVPSLTLWATVAYALHRRAMAHLLERYDRGSHFDVLSFEGAHEADTLLLRSLASAADLGYPRVLRIPMFTFIGADSEIHPADLPRQTRARNFTLACYDDLVADCYRPRLGPRAWLHRIASAFGRDQARTLAGTHDGRRPSTSVQDPDADRV
jgi:GR25 family glycosyltransferase involved in LPS biosynthesis